MKVSIIMPFRNAEPWIHEAIDSIVSQSFDNWELLCIDDRSTDTSPAIVQRCNDDRIQYVSNNGSGIISALQTGLTVSKGEFITRMDADDKMPGKRLEQMVGVINQSEPRTIITGKVNYFSEVQVSDGYRRYEKWLNDRIDRQDHWLQIYRECVIASPNWLVRKSDLIEDKIFDHLKYPEDYDMVFHWYANKYIIKTVNAITLNWREHPQRISRNSKVYDQASFFQLKLDWFVRLNNLQNRSVAVFGAGVKGKIVTEYLKGHGINYSWYDLNHLNYADHVKDPSEATEEIALVCVYPENLAQLENYLITKEYTIGMNAWYF